MQEAERKECCISNLAYSSYKKSVWGEGRAEGAVFPISRSLGLGLVLDVFCFYLLDSVIMPGVVASIFLVSWLSYLIHSSCE